ncbi:MAG TPA: hypothetical protein VL358_01740 [Caulobacteraceae bacterium]|jgi:hypothetical protein|nr:hypothetical protein [Caulobacteraceae bacterium]
MNNADLAEIRALLQASTPVERRSRRPWLGAIRSLLGAAPPAAKPSTPPPRRVGLRPAEPEQAPPGEDLLLSEPIGEDEAAVANEARRRAFGQRQEAALDMVPILRLAGPELPGAAQPAAADAVIGAILRRRGLALASTPAPEETPYHPEDLSDHVEGGAEHLYAEAGLFEPHPAPSCALPPDVDPQGQLLRHLERVFIAEQAALTPP